MFIIFRSQTKQEIAPPSHVVERYIELLCRYQPEAVYNFLKVNDNYRLEEALEVNTSNLIRYIQALTLVMHIPRPLPVFIVFCV